MTVQKVQEQITEAIKQLAKGEAPRLRLSGVGLCPRQQFFAIKEGVVVDLAPMEGILATGKLFEALIAQAFPTAQTQFAVTLEGIVGHIDFYLPDEKVFLECKSIGLAGVDWTPLEHHVRQVMAYHAALVQMGLGVHQAFLVYLPREDIKQLKVHEIPYDDEACQEIIQWLRAMKDALETDRVPPIPAHYRPSKFPCQWFSVQARRLMVCPFHDRCWQDFAVTVTEDEIDEAALELLKAREEKRRAEQEEQRWRAVLLNAIETGQLPVGTRKGKVFISVQKRTKTNYDIKGLVSLVAQRLPDVNLSDYQSTTEYYEIGVKPLKE